jgi:hypothetical protein
MSTQIALAHPEVVFAGRPSIRQGDDAPLVAAPVAARAKEARFAVTGEDISSLLTFVPVGLLALITFGAMLSPQ